MPRQRASIRVTGSELRLQRFQATVAIGGAPVPPFGVNTVAGLTTWWDYSDGTTNFSDAGTTPITADGGIRQTNDKAGANNLSQATAGARPLWKTAVLNGKAVARFDGVDDWMRSTANLVSQPATIFLVGNKNDTNASEHFFDGVDTTRLLMGTDGTHWQVYAGSAAPTGGTLDTSPHVFGFVASGASSVLYVDGTSTISGTNIGTNGFETGVTMGSGTDVPTPLSGFAAVDIAEVLIYNVALSTANKNVVGAYLAGKYGLTWTAI